MAEMMALLADVPGGLSRPGFQAGAFIEPHVARYKRLNDLHDGLTVRAFVGPEVIKIVCRLDGHWASFDAACDAHRGDCHGGPRQITPSISLS